MTNLANYNLWGNTGQDYLLGLGVFIGALVVLKIIQLLVLRYLRVLAERTSTDVDDLIIKSFARLRPPFYIAVSLYSALKYLTLSASVSSLVDRLAFLVVVWYVAVIVGEVVTYAVAKLFARKGDISESVVGTIGSILKAIIWAFAILTVLSNWGVNVTSLVAGLGIGGLAIAFAFQNILEDIFSSFSIFVDKPFREGDFIKVGTDKGVVKYIGLKTTRIETSNGQELIVSNRELTSVRVNNFKRISQRRADFDIGVTYETSKDKLKRVPEIVKEIIEGMSGVEFNRVFLKSFGDSAIVFNIVFYSTSGEFSKYMEVVEKFNYSLFEKFSEEGIEFAYPTQTVFVKK